LKELTDLLTPFIADPNTVSLAVITVSERAVGLGNWRGFTRRQGFQMLALKGGRLDVLMQFHFSSDDQQRVRDDLVAVQGRLLAARDVLWNEGVLRLTPEVTAPVAFDGATNRWRASANYRALYEFTYDDTDGAKSLIARIPVHATNDASLGGPEITTVTDGMARWDNEVAPALVVRGRATVRGLAALMFVPGAPPTTAVTLTRTHVGVVGAPAAFTVLDDFIAALDAGERHAQMRFATLSDFSTAFGSISDAGALGDWNEDGADDAYESGWMPFAPPLRLPETGDRFEVVCESAPLDNVAVIYVRAMKG
jgi:hypothetical protein